MYSRAEKIIWRALYGPLAASWSALILTITEFADLSRKPVLLKKERLIRHSEHVT